MKLWPDRGLWRHRDFLNLWTAQIVSAFGSRITRTALPAMAIVSLGAADAEVALLGALALVPGVVVGIVASGFIDATRKQPLLVAADVVRAVTIASVPLAAWFDVLTMAQIYAVSLVVGAATALFAIADQSFLPAIVGKEHLAEGNAKLGATDSVAEIGGPAIGGILIQLVTAPVAMMIDAVGLIWSAIFLSRIKARETLDAGEGEGIGAAAGGLKAIFASAYVRPLFLAEAIAMFAFGFFSALYMLFLLRELQIDIALTGIIIGFGGVGALAGAMLSNWAVKAFGFGQAVLFFLAVYMTAPLLIPLAVGSDPLSIGLLIAHQLLGDCFGVAYFIQTTTLRQTIMPESVLGRVSAAFFTMNGLMLMVGAFVAVPLADWLGVRPTVWVGILAGMLAIVPVLLSPVVRMRSVEEDAPEAA